MSDRRRFGSRIVTGSSCRRSPSRLNWVRPCRRIGAGRRLMTCGAPVGPAVAGPGRAVACGRRRTRPVVRCRFTRRRALGGNGSMSPTSASGRVALEGPAGRTRTSARTASTPTSPPCSTATSPTSSSMARPRTPPRPADRAVGRPPRARGRVAEQDLRRPQRGKTPACAGTRASRPAAL